MSYPEIAALLVTTHSLFYFAGWVLGMYSKEEE